jgi:alpha-N-arabinofuranosidase
MDEYGPWYRKGTELNQQSIFSQQVTLRDALFTAITLNIFNRHADKISMAACAQTINCLNSLFLAQGDKFLVTPNYYVFEMYLGHQGAQEVRNECFSPASTYKRDGIPASFPSLHSSASLKGKVITLSVVNTDIAEPRETEIVVRGVHIRSVKAEVLSASDRHAHNTFEEVQVGEPAAVAVQYAGNTTHFTFPAASVSVITIELG